MTDHDPMLDGIQRWSPFDPMALMGRHEDGTFVTYADHVAAVAALIDDQAKEIEQYVKAVAEAEQRGYQNGQWSTQQYHADKDYNRGLDAAREAVAALRAPGYEPWGEFIYREVLPAIDGLKGEQA